MSKFREMAADSFHLVCGYISSYAEDDLNEKEKAAAFEKIVAYVEKLNAEVKAETARECGF